MFPFAIIPPFVLSGKEKIKQVAAASYNTMVLTDKGNLYVTGYNRIGELGVGDAVNRYNQWVLVMQDVAWIAAQRETLYAFRPDGKVYSPDTRSSSATAYEWVENTIIADGVSGIGDISGDNIKHLHSDSEGTYLLKKDNSLWYQGNNSQGQAGNGSKTAAARFVKSSDGVLDFSTGGNCVVIKKSDGNFWGWGANSRSIIASGGVTTSPTQMFSTTHTDGTTVTDFMLASDQALLIRYSDGKYRTKGLNIGQLPSGTATPGNVLTDVPDGYTPGDGTEPLIKFEAPIRDSGTYPNYSGVFYYYTGGEFITCGQATGYLTGVNKSSGTVDVWTTVDPASDRISGLKGMTFGAGWVLAYNDTELLYWASVGSGSIIPIVGYIPPGTSRSAWVGKKATSPIAT